MKKLKKTIAFTADVDWACEDVICYLIDIFQSSNIKCTFFCTHDSIALKNCDRRLFEISIHPNFNQLIFNNLNRSVREIISDLLEIYPEAKGVRSHSGTTSSVLQEIFAELGLKYDSNLFFPYNYDIYPYNCWTGLKRIPFNWEDDVHFMYSKSFDYDFSDLFVKNEFYLVMCFHPIHVFLNTNEILTYKKSKPFYHNPKELIKLRNKSEPGVEDLLKKIIVTIKNLGLITYKLSEIIEK